MPKYNDITMTYVLTILEYYAVVIVATVMSVIMSVIRFIPDVLAPYETKKHDARLNVTVILDTHTNYKACFGRKLIAIFTNQAVVITDEKKRTDK